MSQILLGGIVPFIILVAVLVWGLWGLGGWPR
jgi:hypothetical protein